jgi:hypothetical protein
MAILLNGACFAQASDISIPSTILGGTVISIPHRGHLVIDGPSYEKLENELGHDQRQDFVRDMILNTASDELRQKYGSDEHPTTLKVIDNYSMLKRAQDAKKQMSVTP